MKITAANLKACVHIWCSVRWKCLCKWHASMYSTKSASAKVLQWQMATVINANICNICSLSAHRKCISCLPFCYGKRGEVVGRGVVAFVTDQFILTPTLQKIGHNYILGLPQWAFVSELFVREWRGNVYVAESVLWQAGHASLHHFFVCVKSLGPWTPVQCYTRRGCNWVSGISYT